MTDATGQGEILKIVSLFDPGILWPADHADVTKLAVDYRETRVLSKLSFVEGARPKTYTTRKLRSSETADVEVLDGDSRQQRNAFAIGVREVLMPDGETIRPSGARWTDEEMERFGFAAHCEIGSVILTRSRLPLGLRPTYVLPPSLAGALVAWLYRSAVRSPKSADPNSTPPAAPSET